MDDPVEVGVADLGLLASAEPEGPVSTRLDWAKLDDEGFERLLFQLLDVAPGYVDPQWLMRTNAADRGRDISVCRVHEDPLASESRSRVIVQCKHWLKRSVSPDDVTSLLGKLRLWEPPLIDVVIMATTGRFTSDAVMLIDRRNELRERPVVEMWPESHLERLLARFPGVARDAGLR